MKVCRLCQRNLPNKNYYHYSGKRNYLYYRCYDCHKKKNIQYYHQTKPPLKVYDAAYWVRRKLELRKYSRLYMRQRRWRLANPLSKAYIQKLHSDGSFSPSPEWVQDWAEKARVNNNRIIDKYS